jgi:hypothetical protein
MLGGFAEVEAAMGRADDRPREIPQQWLLRRRGDLDSLPGAECMSTSEVSNGSSLKPPIASAGVCSPSTSRTRAGGSRAVSPAIAR